jgi:hypothetical protein
MTGICLLLSFIQIFYKLSLFIFKTFCSIDHTFYNNNIFLQFYSTYFESLLL